MILLNFLDFLGFDTSNNQNKKDKKELYIDIKNDDKKINDNEIIRDSTEEIINMENAPIETKIEEEIVDNKKIKRIIIIRPISNKKAIKNVITEITNEIKR